MCRCVKSEHIVAGWLCCGCLGYSGLQRPACKYCGRPRCHPLKPDSQTGAAFETYDQAYADNPDLLAVIRRELAAERA